MVFKKKTFSKKFDKKKKLSVLKRLYLRCGRKEIPLLSEAIISAIAAATAAACLSVTAFISFPSSLLKLAEARQSL